MKSNSSIGKISNARQRRWVRPALLVAPLLIQLLLPGRASALDPAKDLKQYNCRTWNRQNGLPATSINAIAQTRDGYLWFGTAAGLLRFDGTEFKLFDLHSVAELRNSYVTSLASARSGGLWAGLAHSAFGFYDGQSFSFRGSKEPGLDVQSLVESRNGTLWLAAQQLAGHLNQASELETNLPSASFTNVNPNVKCVYEDRRGRVWFGTLSQGVYYWQDGKITKLSAPELEGMTANCITEDLAGQIWIGTGNGLFCYDASLKRREIPPLPSAVSALLVDQHGVLWIGTSWIGLVRYENGRYDFFLKTDGLDNDAVQALCEDSEGNLWIGTGGGLDQLSDVKFPIQPATDDPKITDANSVTAARNGGVWIASYGGVRGFDPRTKTYTNTNGPGLPDIYTKRVFEARNGDLYFIVGMTNLEVASGGNIVAMYGAPDLVVGMAEDDQGVVVSVAGELYRAGTNYFRPYTFKGSERPQFHWIANLASGRDGVIWVASGTGIFRVKDGAWQSWAAAEGLADPAVLTICEDQDGVVWAGLLSGIARLKDNQIRLISRQDGLFDDNIYAIVPDDLGNLWVDSGRGISRVARRDINAFADGNTNHVACTVFDGLDSVKTTDKTAQERVGCKTADGRIWFPGPLGVVMIDPAHVLTNPVAPPVHILRVLADGREVARNVNTVVPPGKGELEFHFDALSFNAPSKVQIRYRLEGYDNDWVDAGDRRLAFYTNLKPGPYTFRVIAANADDVWNEQGDTMAISLRPHYYQTAWFLLSCVGLAFVALFGIYLQRVRRLNLKQEALQKNRALLEAEVLKRTAELANERRLLRTLIDNLPDIVFAKDSRSRFTLANTACARQLGASRAEAVLGKTDADFVSPELGSQYLADEQALMQSGRPLTKEEPTQNMETGETRESLTTKVPLKDDSGKVVGLVGIARDITERKLAEQKLAESRHFLDRIINTVPDPIFVKDRQHRGVMVNDAFCHLMGLKREELLGKSDHDHDCFTSTQANEFRSKDELVFTTGNENINEETLTAADGTVHFVITKKALYTDEQGEKFIVGVIQDITERKQAEEALRQSREEFKDLFDNAPVGFHEIDAEGRLVRINNTELKMLGYSAGELLGQFVWKISADEEVSRRAALAKLAGEPPPPHDFERRLRRKDGSTLPVLINDRVLHREDGAILGIRSAIQDNTERKRAEEALAAEQRLLSSLITATPDAIYFKDRESRFIRINEALVLKLGLSDPSAALGKTDFDMFGEQHAREAYADEQRIMATGEPMIDKEEREDLKDGHVTWASSTKMPMRDTAGKIIGIMGISRDITERKRIEDHLIQSQKLETVGKLAGGIAHEFNSILTAIIGQAELLREDLPAGSPLAQNATAISQAADRAAILTRQLLAYGRKQFLRPEPLNLNQVITGMSGVLSHLMGGDTVAVSLVPAAGLQSVKADAGQIEQVIMNLAMNARDAMPGGGKLTLETASVTLGPDDVGRYPELKPGGYVMLAISDTGRGMSEGVKARAFEPFFTTKDVGQGTGLGLSTCYGIIKQSGGHINVYSEPGRGTTFKIYLPQVASLPQVPVERLESPQLPRGTETILLVEDDPALREMAAALLRRLGYTVLAAANGVEALSLKQQRDTGHVDLLLTDVVMPHMSGKELADRVRALYPHTRILFTSAYTENAITQQGALDKGVALLQKPFTPSALARKVREAMDALAAPKPDPARKTSGGSKIADETMTPGN